MSLRAENMGVRKMCAICGFTAMAAMMANAGTYTETFSEGSAGWGSSGTVSFINEEVQLNFAQKAGPPSSETVVIFCAEGSDGHFVGNLAAKGAHILGFDYTSLSPTPSALRMRIYGAGRSYQRALTPLVEGAGVHTLAVSLDGKAVGKWVGPGDEADFAATVAAIDQVLIEVDRSVSAAALYRVDNVFIDGVPVASLQAKGEGGEGDELPDGLMVSLESLRSNRTYRILTSTNLMSGVWTETEEFRAEGDLATFDWVGEDSVGFLRLDGATD